MIHGNYSRLNNTGPTFSLFIPMNFNSSVSWWLTISRYLTVIWVLSGTVLVLPTDVLE